EKPVRWRTGAWTARKSAAHQTGTSSYGQGSAPSFGRRREEVFSVVGARNFAAGGIRFKDPEFAAGEGEAWRTGFSRRSRNTTASPTWSGTAKPAGTALPTIWPGRTYARCDGATASFI